VQQHVHSRQVVGGDVVLLAELERAVAKRKEDWSDPAILRWRLAVRRLLLAIPQPLRWPITEVWRSDSKAGHSLRYWHLRIVSGTPLPEKIPAELLQVFLDDPDVETRDCENCKLEIPYHSGDEWGRDKGPHYRYFERCPGCGTPSLEHMPMKPSTPDVSIDHATASHSPN
jgi:hypothetical protein